MAHYRGSGDRLPIDQVRHGNDGTLRGHIHYVTKSSDEFSDLLDLYAQFNFDYFSRQVHSVHVPMDQHPLGLKALKNIFDINARLEHEACMFRIVPDEQHVFSVQKIGSKSLRETSIKPALSLLREDSMIDALKEYEEALVEWAQGKTDDAILHASHAVESVMKFILADLGIPIRPDANPSQLIAACVNDARLLPAKYHSFWAQLSQGIQGVITVRSSASGAGHGPAPGAGEPEDYTAEYAVNMAGANIVFLIRRWREMR